MRDGTEPTPPTHGEDDDFTATALDAPGGAPDDAPGGVRRALAPTRRGRRARMAALGVTALLVVVVVVGLFARATSDPGAAVATLLGLPTPTSAATLVPGVNLIYASDGAPWGTLTLDGRRMPTADMLGNGFTVSRGAHHLVYQARYFPTLRCVFSVPPDRSDTCPMDTSSAANQFLLTHGHGRVLDLGSTGLTLRSDQRTTLIELADSILAAQSVTATIAPGDRYLDDRGRVVAATAPLRFSMALALDGGQGPGVGTYCAQFCPDPSFVADGQLSQQVWPTRVTVAASWAITDASGRRLTGLSYQAGQPYPGSVPLTIGVQLTPAGWEISGLEQQGSAAVLNAAMAVASDTANAAVGSSHDISIVTGQPPLEGCVLTITFQGVSPTLLWRFGALLALDSDAHKFFPQLPVATAAEQAIAATIQRQGQPPQP